MHCICNKEEARFVCVGLSFQSVNEGVGNHKTQLRHCICRGAYRSQRVASLPVRSDNIHVGLKINGVSGIAAVSATWCQWSVLNLTD